MKKLLALLLVVMTVFAFAACSQNEVVAEGTVTIVEYVADGDDIEYVVDLAKVENATSLFDVLTYLKNEKSLTFEYSGEGESTFCTAFGSLSQDTANGIYLYLYTSVESDFDVSGFEKTMTYKNQTLTSSGVGVTQMKLEDGAVYYIGLIVYTF